MDIALSLPQLIGIPDFGRQNNMSRAQAYYTVNNMPASVKIRIGGRLWLNANRLAEYLENGGDIARL